MDTHNTVEDILRRISAVCLDDLVDILNSYTLPASWGPALWDAMQPPNRVRFVAQADHDLLGALEWPQCECPECGCLRFAEREEAGTGKFCLECLDDCPIDEDDCPHCGGSGTVKITRKAQREQEQRREERRRQMAASIARAAQLRSLP